MGLADEESEFVLSQGLWRFLCIPLGPLFLQFP